MTDHSLNDLVEFVDERQNLRKELEETQGQLREALNAARPIPGLEAEVGRLNDLIARHQADAERRQAENGELDTRVRELEADLRHKEGLEEELHDATVAAERAETERDEAFTSLAAEKSEHDKTLTALEEARKEIDRLKPHEEHTGLFAELLKLTKEIL